MGNIALITTALLQCYIEKGRLVRPFFVGALFFTVPFIEPNIYADALARDLLALATGCLAAAWISDEAYRQPISPWSWLFLLLCLTPAAIILSTEAAQAPWFVWRQSLYLTAAWYIFTMLQGCRKAWFSSPSWAIMMVVFAHLYILYALIEAFHLQWFDNGNLFLVWSHQTAHFSGPLRQQNQQALFLVIATILAWRQALSAPPFRRWQLAAILPICGVFLTASRSGLLVLLFAALLVWLFDRRRSLMMLTTTLLSGLLLSMTILALTPNPTDTSVAAHVATALNDSTPSIRIMVWHICLQLWQSHPWLGIGWGNLAAHFLDGAAIVIPTHPEFAPISSNLGGGVTQAHNLILQFLVEGGVLAASALLLLFVALAKKAQQWWKAPPTGASSSVSGWICAMVLLAHGMVSIALMEPFFMVLLAMALAACFSVASHDD